MCLDRAESVTGVVLQVWMCLDRAETVTGVGVTKQS